MGDHSEAIRIEYDPTVLHYGQLLDVFWADHDPSWRSSRQYRSAIFVHDDAQRRVAERALAEHPGALTAIEPAGTFTPAEAYHQKYYLRGSGLAKELAAMYPDDPLLVRSTAAARINGYLGGYAKKDQLEAEIDDLGLSDAGAAALRQRVSR